MVNSEQFAKRIEQILEFYDISAANFAEAIEVGRSSISHILSGRNKPSLDFVMKVVQTFPEVELYWLLKGKGSFPPASGKDKKPEAIPDPENKINLKPERSGEEENKEKLIPRLSLSGKQIKKVILLYEDGSFDAFEN